MLIFIETKCIKNDRPTHVLQFGFSNKYKFYLIGYTYLKQNY